MSKLLTKKVHKLSSNHRELIKVANKATCFYCFNSIKYEDIADWIDNDNTAVCPCCGVDSVVPNITSNLIKHINKEYF